MAHHVIRGSLLWAAIAFLASSTWAKVPVVPGARGPGSAAAPPPAAQQAVVAEPQILLAPVDPDEKVVVWGGVRLQFSLVNGSLNSGIGTKSLALSLPPALPLKAPGKQARPDGTCPFGRPA